MTSRTQRVVPTGAAMDTERVVPTGAAMDEATVSEASVDEPVPSDGLELILGLLVALDEAGIDYCHWKSNEAIASSLSADNDLDLLVAEHESDRFDETMTSLGFRVARPSADRRVPGLVDYFGRDGQSGRMVHVQAHFQLVVGDDMTKNFRLPFEEAYLAARRREGPIAVADPNFELLVFLVRMTIKHCPWDALVSRKGRLTASERRELADLEEKSDPAVVDELRARHLPAISADLLDRCRAALEPSAGYRQRADAGRRLLRAITPLGRRSRSTDLRLRLWRRYRRRRQQGQPVSRRRLDSGGLLVGVVGGDGSGKSSTVTALHTTFSRHFPTHLHHLGKPNRSLSSRILRRLMRKMPLVDGRTVTSLPAWTDFEELGFPGYRYVLWHLSVARDRQREYRRARRAADNGSLVICDRFPLDAITMMDSPRVGSLPGLDRRPLVRRLANLEARYYQGIGEPDLLLVLRVDPDVAVARRGEQDAEFVRRRAEEVWNHDWAITSAVVLDASRPQDAVLADAHAAVWQRT